MAVIASYSNSLKGTFQFDDRPNITQNKSIHDLSNISEWWNFVPSRPLGTLSFALNYHFSDSNVVPYHVTNVIIHLINSLLVFWLTIVLFKTAAMEKHSLASRAKLIAFSAALLFACHPLFSQAVSYIVQRLASLSALFYLTSLCLYIQARVLPVGRKRKIIFFLLSGLSALAGMLTKETSYTLPLAVILCETMLISPGKWSAFFRSRAFLFTGIILSVLTIVALSNFNLDIFNDIPPTQGNNFTITPVTYFLTQFRVLTTYLRLFILPYGQHLDWAYPMSYSIVEWKTAASLLFLVLLAISAFYIRKKNILVSFGILWFFVASSVESGIIPIPNLIFEHRAYLPGIGLAVALISLVFSIPKSAGKNLPLILISGVAVLFIFLTRERNEVWKTELSLWKDCVEKSPQKPRCNNNYGYALYSSGKFSESIRYFVKAISLSPSYELAYNNRGNAYVQTGEIIKALSDYTMAVELHPGYHEAYYNRGNAYIAIRNFRNAINDFNRCLKLDSTYYKAYVNRGNAKASLGDIQGALPDFNKGLQYVPDDRIALYNRGCVYFDLGDLQAACNDWNLAAKYGSRDAENALNKHCK